MWTRRIQVRVRAAQSAEYVDDPFCACVEDEGDEDARMAIICMHAEVEVSAFFAGSDLPTSPGSLRLRDENDTLRPTGDAVVASVRSREEEDSKMEGGREGGRKVEKVEKSKKLDIFSLVV